MDNIWVNSGDDICVFCRKPNLADSIIGSRFRFPFVVASTLIGVFRGSNIVILHFPISNLVLSSLNIGSPKIMSQLANAAKQKVTS